MKSVQLIVAFVFFMLPVESIFAQSSHQIFEHLTTDHGLSSNKAVAILQDKEGFYWIATQNGLNRFDGTQFKVFRHDKNDSTSLSHNYCTILAEDRHGDIWVATYKGISRYMKDKGYFKQIYLDHPSQNFEITNRIPNLVADASGDIWFASIGLWKYDLLLDSVIYFYPPNKAASFVNQINHLVFDAGLNGLWFNSTLGLFFFSITEEKFYHKDYNSKGWKVFDHADYFELCIDYKNRLWFRDRGTQSLAYFTVEDNEVHITSKKILHGVKKISSDEKNRIWIFYWLEGTEIFDPITGQTDSSFFLKYHRRSALSKLVNYLYIDQQRNWWIASDKGISIFNQANQYYKLHRFDPEASVGPELSWITAIAQSTPGHLWIGTKVGLYTYDLSRGSARRIALPAGMSNIITLCAAGDRLWIGINDRIVGLDTRSEIMTENIQLLPGVFFIRKGNENELWIGLWTKGLYRLNLHSQQLDRFTKDSMNISSLKSNSLITGFYDSHSFWVGYNGGAGFSAKSDNSDEWIHFHPQNNDPANAHAGTITAISGSNTDILWVGTYGGGVFRYNRSNDKFDSFEQIQGLNSNFINSMIHDDYGGLWISTTDGMNYMNTTKGSIRSLDVGMVFQNNIFIANGLENDQGKLYFFCQQEVLEIDPALFKTSQQFPSMVISEFKVFDQEMPVSFAKQKIYLTHDQNFFSFGFSSVRTNPGQYIQYAYRLKGFDKSWNIAGKNQPFASYTNVPSGNYFFEVKATNDEGLWSEPLIRIPLYISPPFWHTWWFILLATFIMVAAIYTLYHYRVQHLRKIFSIRTRISRDLHDDIGASLSSIHFNSSVAAREVKQNPDKATQILSQISQNSRQVIEDISDIVWANAEHKENSSLSSRIKNYGYDLLSQKNIECRYVIDAHAERKLTNPEARRNVLLIIKEAMNNIAKYSGADFAEVYVVLNEKHLHLDISDNGKGFDILTVGKGNGLANMKKRAQSLGGTFHVCSLKEGGTKIHCSMPIPKISDI